ncbi:ectoine/hydroxyectoine ABC transporter substrate-binding protein EhuB, partial [Streptomyces sp. NPDC060131]
MAPPHRTPPWGISDQRPRTAGPTRRSLLVGVAALGALGAAGCSRVATASDVKGGDLLDRLR